MLLSPDPKSKPWVSLNINWCNINLLERKDPKPADTSPPHPRMVR